MNAYFRMLSRVIATAFTLMILIVVPVSSQVTTGDINGRVTDSQGKVVSGATITATNKGTGASRSATTSDDGEYTIARLSPGTYDLSVEAKGFSKPLVKDLELNVGATLTQNFELKPGEVSETVIVTTEGALVQTTTSELARSITPTEVRELPLINRTF